MTDDRSLKKGEAGLWGQPQERGESSETRREARQRGPNACRKYQKKCSSRPERGS